MGLLLLILATLLMLLGALTYFGKGPVAALMRRKFK